MNGPASAPNSPPPSPSIARPETGWCAYPLDAPRLFVADLNAALIVVRDGAGRPYFRTPAAPTVEFMAGGALGTHTAQ